MKVFISAGETSGDAHAAKLVVALKKKDPALKFFGMGGHALRETGVSTIVDSEHSGSIMGFTEVLAHLSGIRRSYRSLKDAIYRERPQIAIVVDFPDFNFLLLKHLKNVGAKIVYFITPQVWAWRTGRVKTLKKYIDLCIPILPFEENFLKNYGLNVKYFGSPLMEKYGAEIPKNNLREELKIKSKVIALIPGSRKGEVEKLLPVMVEAFTILKKTDPNLIALIPAIESLDVSLYAKIKLIPDVKVLTDKFSEILAVADFAFVASGTASLQTAIANVPLVVTYKMTPLSYKIARRLVKGVKFFSLVNLVYGGELVRELLQTEVTPEKLASEGKKLLQDLEYQDSLKVGFEVIRNSLISPTNAIKLANDVELNLFDYAGIEILNLIS